MTDLFANTDLTTRTGSSAKLSSRTKDGTTVIGIFFSSSWCPDCVPFVAKLATMYEEINNDAEDEEEVPSSAKLLEIIFVSSDRDEASMMKYMKGKHEDWLAVPFEDVSLRSELKRKYGTCAGSERVAVGVTDRRRGIPTLIVVDSAGNEICDGTDDVDDYAGGALPARWVQM
eukprot:CAMPEP_0178565582 /NCGR_PEP_ID=MMETSP0697-20121206/14254_1 /TAXON_ID=265572 /ORGANISM="Extubocellulus spinifer, Strain CCMP396" /LENGTH=172 /DNA_ID=CAMNT_0020199229 /DNA_START=22 /DNA_END=543 /DNA_ORIENTATION=-